MGILSDLNREQKEAVGLLSIGTFLEYFDLMLYVHMAVLLNELFFPTYDPQTTSLLAALAFCSTFIFRPIGALIFGWIGDRKGRKKTIILTTMTMCVSCIVMASLPTYAQIGITATWIMMFCRVAQGMSSMGESIGAQIYLRESIRPPACYPIVSFISIACALGGLFALGIATLVTSVSLNWRYAFFGGALIAFIGAFARTRLRETPEFLEMKRQEQEKFKEEWKKEWDTCDDEELSIEFFETLKETNPDQYLEKIIEFRKQTREMVQESIPNMKGGTNLKTLFSYFLIYCGWPLSFYLAFIYFNPVLKGTFGYSSDNIIRHNFYLSTVMLISCTFWTSLSYRIYPLKIMKMRGILTLFLMISLPYLIKAINSPSQLFVIQALILLIPLANMPADAIFLNRLPMLRRFTFACFSYAVAQALMFMITSFGLVFLGSFFGSYGLWIITLPVTVAFLYGVYHFEWLDREHERELQREREEDDLYLAQKRQENGLTDVP